MSRLGEPGQPTDPTIRVPSPPYAPRRPNELAADRLRAGKKTRPSGYDINEAAFQRANGPIPGNLIVAGGASGSDAYSRQAKAAGLPLHPARYPEEVPRRIILLTSREGDLCYDPMAG
jgi:site-specific DNA-methyltransferase (cytosine-N4-specific)